MLITDAKGLTAEQLTTLLRTNGIIDQGDIIDKVRIIKASNSTTASHYQLAIQYKYFQAQRYVPDKVFLKLTRGQPQIAQQEIDFYTKIAPAMSQRFSADELCLIQVYSAEFDPETGLSHLLLEDLTERYKAHHDPFPPSVRHREQIISALARFHAFWWEHPDLATYADLPSEASIQENYASYQKKYADFVAFSGKHVKGRYVEILKQISLGYPQKRYENLIKGKNITLVHRGLHPKNFMYSSTNSRILDWQSWRIDTATDDLAYMMACHYPDHLLKFEERRLLEKYYQTLIRERVQGYSWDDFIYDYRASVARCLGFLLAGWTREKMLSGYWHRMETALDAFDKLEVMALYALPK